MPQIKKFVNVLVHAYYYDSAEFNFKPDQNKNRWKKYNAHFTFLTTKQPKNEAGQYENWSK